MLMQAADAGGIVMFAEIAMRRGEAGASAAAPQAREEIQDRWIG
jgi:hypothetical protein